MFAFVLAIFLSAFLLFQVQLIVARYILPWFGGSPAVWATCMLFFQAGLLAGYAYAHGLATWFRGRPRLQAGIHLAVLALSLLCLPITPPESLKPTGAEISPVLGIVRLLAVTVGLPYVAISASGPLLQHWFGAVATGRSPYRLYAVSNFGSLLGLLTYPVLIEPFFRLGTQTGLWSIGYGVYGLLAAVCARAFLKSSPASPASAVPEAGDNVPAPAADRVLWVALSACGSLLLLATTNRICQDVAVVPFLWALPLSLYLVTFIVAFDGPRWYWRPFWIAFAAVSIGAAVWLMNQDFGEGETHVTIQIAIYAAAMFSACMVCHGEMTRLKPHPRYLTGFYLAVAFGGVLGGAFVSLAAPRIFSGYWELHAGLVAFALLAGACLWRGGRRSEIGVSPRLRAGGAVAWIGATGAMMFSLHAHYTEVRDGAIQMVRNFYGVLGVYEGYVDTEDHYRALFHGRISHGRQYLDEQFRYWPYTYYGENSGPGVFFRNCPGRGGGESPRPLRYGVVGLGIGTLAAYAHAGDEVRFYEINPQVEELARSRFTYLDDCDGTPVVVLGDARITLQREAAGGEEGRFDAIFVDAFSGDSIPMHLLTLEAFELYFRHLRPDGALLVHISNLHLDLSDPVRTLARELGREAVQIDNYPDNNDENASRWVLVTKNRALIDAAEAEGALTPWETESPREMRWTDDYSNLLQAIAWD